MKSCNHLRGTLQKHRETHTESGFQHTTDLFTTAVCNDCGMVITLNDYEEVIYNIVAKRSNSELKEAYEKAIKKTKHFGK